MRLSVVWTILLKELLETLRDRRTLMRVLLLPMLIYPLFAIGLSKLQGSAMDAREAQRSRVAVWGDPPEEVRRGLEEQGKFTLVDWAGAPEELRAGWSGMTMPAGVEPDAVEAQETTDKKRRLVPRWWVEPENAALEAARGGMRRREVDAIVAFWPGFGATLEAGGKGRVAVYFDPVRQESSLARDRLERALRLERKALQAGREAGRGLPGGYSTPYEILTRTAAVEERAAGQILGSMMPMVLILMSVLGGFLPAIDLTAGEKERGTMQTLLCAPLRPIEIIGGKFLAVFVISLLTALLNVVSLALTMGRILPGDVDSGVRTYVLTALLLVPVNFLFSALFLALATFARDFKDGQNVLMPAYLPLTLLAGLTSLPGVELNRVTALVPVLNVALLIKALFLSEAQVELAFFVLASSSVYAALALALAARVFSQETVLLGGQTTWRELLGVGQGRGEAPGPGFALTCFATGLVGVFYGSLLLERAPLIAQFLGTQLVFFLLVPLAGVRLYGFSLQKTYALRWPRGREVVGGALMGLSAWAPVAAVSAWLVPPTPEFVKAMEQALLFGGVPWPVLMLLVAVVPAVCEETLFRGLIQGGLRGGLGGLVGSSLLFGLAHGSVYRLLPTFLLGMAMGTLRQRSGSLLPSMVFHALNNGLLVSLVYFRPRWSESMMGSLLPPWWLLGAGLGVFALGAAVAFGGRRASSAS